MTPLEMLEEEARLRGWRAERLPASLDVIWWRPGADRPSARTGPPGSAGVLAEALALWTTSDAERFGWSFGVVSAGGAAIWQYPNGNLLDPHVSLRAGLLAWLEARPKPVDPFRPDTPEEAAKNFDRNALLDYLGDGWRDCTHEGIGLPGCPTCEGRWGAEVRRVAQAHRDRWAIRALEASIPGGSRSTTAGPWEPTTHGVRRPAWGRDAIRMEGGTAVFADPRQSGFVEIFRGRSVTIDLADQVAQLLGWTLEPQPVEQEQGREDDDDCPV